MTASRSLRTCGNAGTCCFASSKAVSRATVRMMRSRIRERPEFTCGPSRQSASLRYHRLGFVPQASAAESFGLPPAWPWSAPMRHRKNFLLGDLNQRTQTDIVLVLDLSCRELTQGL